MRENIKCWRYVDHCFSLHKMKSNKSYGCACCDDRLNVVNRRPLNGICIRLFVAARVFPTSLEYDSYICTKCRSMYNKWKAVPEFFNLLTMVENNQKTAAIAAGNIGEEGEEAAACVHDENGSDWSTNDTSRGTDSMDDDSAYVETMDASSIGVSVDDSTVNSDHVEDEKITSDEDSEAVNSA